MKNILIIAVSILTGVSASYSAIQSINASDLNTSFTAVSGLLSISDNADIVVENTLGQQITYTQGMFVLNTSLQADNSIGGIAIGYFTGGELYLSGSDTNLLLTGDIIFLDIIEVFNGYGLLTVQGEFEVTGGLLESNFASLNGDIVQITFNVIPTTIRDFSADFTGSSNVTILPVPEPAMIAMFGLGSLLFVRRCRNKSN